MAGFTAISIHAAEQGLRLLSNLSQFHELHSRVLVSEQRLFFRKCSCIEFITSFLVLSKGIFKYYSRQVHPLTPTYSK